MTARTAHPRNNRLYVLIGALCALIVGVGSYLGVAQPWNTEASPAQNLPCAERIPAHVGETCTDRVTLGGATGERYYVAERVTPDSNVIDFDKRKLTVTISGKKPSLDDFCNADAIASLTDDHNSVTHNAQANTELCDEIRDLTISQAYDADDLCEYKMGSLKHTDSITWDQLDTPYFTDKAVKQICSTPLWPTPPNEVTHA